MNIHNQIDDEERVRVNILISKSKWQKIKNWIHKLNKKRKNKRKITFSGLIEIWMDMIIEKNINKEEEENKSLNNKEDNS